MTQVMYGGGQGADAAAQDGGGAAQDASNDVIHAEFEEKRAS